MATYVSPRCDPAVLNCHPLAHLQSFRGPKVVKRSPYVSVAVLRSFAGISALAPISLLSREEGFQTLRIAPIWALLDVCATRLGLGLPGATPFTLTSTDTPWTRIQWCRRRSFSGIDGHRLRHTLRSFPASPWAGLTPAFTMTRTRRHFLLRAVSCSHTFRPAIADPQGLKQPVYSVRCGRDYPAASPSHRACDFRRTRRQ